MPASTDELISILNGLIETCEDGVHGFRTAAARVDDPDAKAALLSRVSSIELAAGELQAEVRGLGGEPAKRGSVEGAVHRGWMTLKSAATVGNRDAILTECERGEEHAAERYTEALRKDLPTETSVLLIRHQRGVLQNIDRVRGLRRAAAPQRTSGGLGTTGN